jgi:hypothetical protein
LGGLPFFTLFTAKLAQGGIESMDSMDTSVSDFIELRVINIKGQKFDAILSIAHDGRSLLALRADLDPEVADTIEYDASQVVKKETGSLNENKDIIGKAWLNGKWTDLAIDFTGVFDEVLYHYELNVVISDRPR